MNGAAHARPGLIAGLVLTESVSVPGRLSTETVFDADPQGVRSPVLVVANHDDACEVAPPEMASRIAASLTSSQSVRVSSQSAAVCSVRNGPAVRCLPTATTALSRRWWAGSPDGCKHTVADRKRHRTRLLGC
jgi:hypothetical protein